MLQKTQTPRPDDSDKLYEWVLTQLFIQLVQQMKKEECAYYIAHLPKGVSLEQLKSL